MTPIFPSSKRSPSSAGFTLFEVLVAIVILVLGIIAVGQTVNMAFRATAASEAHLKALNFARLELERLRQRPFSSEDLEDGTRSFTKTFTNLNNVVAYSGTVSISTATNAYLKHIIMQIDWRTPYHRTPPPPAEIQTTLSRSLRV